MRLWSRTIQWLNRRRLDEADFQDEIRAHLQIAADERVAAGADRDRARLDSLKEFGNLTLTTESARSIWTPRWLETVRDWLSDARYGLRVLAKRPGFSLTVIVVLVLGIGLNTAVFALFKSLALSPLAGVERSSGLRVVLNEMPSGRRDGLSYPDYRYLRDHDRAFNGLVGSVLTAVHVGRGSRTRQVMGELVTGNYFLELGVGAQLGRTLLPSDEVAPGGHPVVVLSDGLWRRAFAADPNVIGTTVHLNTVPMTVVGVADPAFHGTIVSFDIELFAPVMMAPQIGGGFLPQTTDLLSDRNIDFLMVLGRLRPEVTLGDANAQMEVFSEQLQREAGVGEVRRQVKVVPIWQSPYGAQTYMLPAVTVLGAMSALLLLIACANIAGLALVRAVSRRGEIGLRLAVGATRVRIVRLLLIENLVLAVPAALLGLVAVSYGVPILFATVSQAAPGRLFLNVTVDRLVIGFSVLAACISAVAVGLVPALRATRLDLMAVVNEDISPRGAAKGRLRSALVVSQVAVSMLLLVAAGLVAKSLGAAQTADVGFDPDNVFSVRIDLRPNGYDEARGRVFYEQLLNSLSADPAVESVTLAANPPLTLVDTDTQAVAIDGYVPHQDEELSFLWNPVAPDYFRTLKIGVLAGREFERRDDAGAAPVAIVNETMARRFWGGPAQALGQRIRLSSNEWRRVVGVVRDVKYARVNETSRPYVYVPFLQSYRSGMVIHARGAAGLIDVARTQIAVLDPDLLLLEARSLREQTSAALAILQMAANMLFIFGVAGMLLAGLGIYGLVWSTVKQSTHEIGIRMALGAQRPSLVWTFLGRGVRLGVVGAALGTGGAAAVTGLLSSVLYGVSATDPPSFLRALAVVLGAVLVATLIPAWRAVRINSLTALLRP